MAYSHFASYYDVLTSNINYEKQGRYILSLLQRYGHKPGLTLDLACGTGSLTIWLKQHGVDVYGVDMSDEMLSAAQQKAAEAELSLLFLRQKMEDIDLYGTIDTCVCTLDSLNHLKSEKELKKTFGRVSLFMNKGGLFIFDMNTLYKHREILGNNTFVYDKKDVYCVWQNTLGRDLCTVNISLDFFERDGAVYRRFTESFAEKAYSVDDTKSFLKDAGFELLDVFLENSFEKPTEKAQRNFFVARKE